MSTSEATIDRVKGVVATVFKADRAGLTPASRFVEDLRGKSMNTIELAAMLEAEFGVAVSVARVRKARTVGEAADLVDALLGADASA